MTHDVADTLAQVGTALNIYRLSRDGFRTIPHASKGIALLWALAREIDDVDSTATGEHVCRSCSGRGEVLIPLTWFELLIPLAWFSFAPCSCDGPTRPDTISLRWLVVHLASQRSPVVADWPEQWAVDCDAMEAAGWQDATLHDGRDVPTWQAVWWREFREWVTTGAEPDAVALAEVLQPLADMRRKKQLARLRSSPVFAAHL